MGLTIAIATQKSSEKGERLSLSINSMRQKG